MKQSFLILLTFMSVLMCSASSYNKNDDTLTTENNIPMANGKIKIKIGSKTFSATLYDNEAAKAFRLLLPLTIRMDELNGNEKKYDFPKDFPTDDYSPKQIGNGDLMIWSGNTLVLFYKSFSTPYSYTKLGKINDAAGLASEVGSGDLTVTFEAE